MTTKEQIKLSCYAWLKAFAQATFNNCSTVTWHVFSHVFWAMCKLMVAAMFTNVLHG
jgi:hypothetical protein